MREGFIYPAMFCARMDTLELFRNMRARGIDDWSDEELVEIFLETVRGQREILNVEVKLREIDYVVY
jgi:DNA repair protein RadC